MLLLYDRVFQWITSYTLILFIASFTLLGIVPEAIGSFNADGQENVGFKIVYIIFASINMIILGTYQISFVLVLVHKRQFYNNFYLLGAFVDMVSSIPFSYGMMYSAILRFNQSALTNIRNGWVFVEYLQTVNMAFGINGTMGSTLEANIFYMDIILIVQKFTTICNFLIVASLVWRPFVNGKAARVIKK